MSRMNRSTYEMSRREAPAGLTAPSGELSREVGIGLVAFGLIALAGTGIVHYAMLERSRTTS